MSTHATTAHTCTIKEAAKLSGLPESTLRYYETIGLIHPIGRNTSSKHRVYNEEDLLVVDALACLNATGMSINDMRTYLKNRVLGVQAADEQVALLESRKRRLSEEALYLQLQQRYVDLKIAYWHAIATNNMIEAKTISERARRITQELKLPKEQ